MKTKIEWADYSWNPLRGCTRVSAGCHNCYAERMAHRFSGPGQPYEGLTEMRNGRPSWTGKITLAEHKLTEPLRRKKPTRYFVNSMADLFHDGVPFEFIWQLFAVMARTPHHTYMILTKRPERMAEEVNHMGSFIDPKNIPLRVLDAVLTRDRDNPIPWPLPNVYLGVSVEDQAAADERIPHLLATPAAVRFVSCEPLLGPVDLSEGLRGFERREYVKESGEKSWYPAQAKTLDWVIAGGESGPRARPAHPDWFRRLRDQCAEAGVPFFFKQWGEWIGTGEGTNCILSRAQELTGQMLSDCKMYRVGKTAAGRLLDGVEHNGMPEGGGG